MENETAAGRSEQILEEIRKRRERERIIDVEERKIKVVIFSLQGDSYAFYGEHIKEILSLVPIFPVPGAASFIPGIINNRGEIESVININRFLGLPEAAPALSGRIAIADAGGVRSGILVDAIEEVLDIPASGIKPPLDTLSPVMKEFVAGQFRHQEQHVMLLDAGKILGKIT